MRHRRLPIVAALVLSWALASPVSAATWLWDQNHNKIDDRIEGVNTNGLAWAHVGHDLSQRLILFVYPETIPMTYGVYVGYDHHPTDADVTALEATGATVSWRPRYINYLRAKASFTQIQALASLGGVTRVEGWQVLYATNDNATRTLRARASDGGVGTPMFPSVWADLGITGRGIVVGIIDTGVNDDVNGAGYPGHESLRGKFVGGGDFSNPDPSLNTSPDSSVNPRNNADPLGDYHATHVAGTAIGTGGPEGIRNGAVPGPYAGMAPDARLVDLKALTDAGEGGGAAECLEWCMIHRNTVWSVNNPDASYRGVQVVNMSLGGASASDGTDADCAAVNAAVRAGIVVCVATGNDGKTNYMPSPAAADLDVSVGAFQDANTTTRSDDIVANYSNEGPRMDDGDTDHLDEMKPSVLGSGSDIVSALGDPTTDGRRYHNINGTSMATPTIAGLCALILQANPGLTPMQVRDILQNTADHRTDHGQQPPSASDPFHIDPNYHPSWGWGQPDAYAAVKEALNDFTTQVISETAAAANIGGQLQITVTWITQREILASRFDVWRASDLGGYAGDFAIASPDIAPHGHPEIARQGNRTGYVWTDTDAALLLGRTYWYQVRWTDMNGNAHVEPAFPVRTDVPPVRARVRWVISHNAIDNDIFARYGSGTDPNAAAFVRPTPGSTAADSMQVVTPAGFGGGTIRYFFHADLTDRDAVGDFLPPSAANPWFLSVLEKGYVNTEGLVDSFSVQVFDGATNPTYRAPNPSTPTVEGQTTVFWIPADPATSLNHAPVLDPIGNRSVGEGLTLNFQVHANDADGNPLTYSTSALPAGASFNAGTRVFDWSPAFGQAGAYNVTFRVADNQAAADSEVVTITVQARAPGSNTAPTLATITDQTTHVERALSFTATAQDKEGGPLAFSASHLPAGATFDANAQRFDWTPQPGQEGTYSLTVHVTDNAGAADSQAVTVMVLQENGTPLPVSCTPDTTTFNGTIGANVQGALVVETFHPFTVPANTQVVKGALSWTGGPAIDLDLYLLDPSGNVVQSGATATNDPEEASYANPAPGVYQWRVDSYDNPNPSLAYTVTSIRCLSPAAGVDGGTARIAFALEQNAPNPFTRSSVIRFALPQGGNVRLRVYDIAGRVVRTLANGVLPAGVHQRVWDGRDDAGTPSHPGIYFYRLDASQGTRARKMIFLR